jgi:hypothetical protein
VEEEREREREGRRKGGAVVEVAEEGTGLWKVPGVMRDEST